MIKEDKYVASHRPYAVDPSTYERYVTDGLTYQDNRADQRIHAVWFRRKNGLTVAYYGLLWDISDATTAEEMLAKHDDGRYGGSWAMGWDGDTVRLESPLTSSAYDRMSGILREALPRFEAEGLPPVGYDGWWTFHR